MANEGTHLYLGCVNEIDRVVRARIYELFVSGVREIDASMLGLDEEVASASMARLADEHRLLLTDEDKVWMAHPFSGVDTGHTATVGDRTWWANCAWDALAILSLLGDGVARCPNGPVWTVEGGVVSPGGLVHLLVPAARFWDDVAFT